MDKKIYVDSVWSKYGLGILGVAGEAMLGSDLMLVAGSGSAIIQRHTYL